ncbi:hypothetical protein PanWU01x14_209830 [Parasponia andersonii]|uniref:Uncharacterized protein n=1 Tax=Parasponia andersonii TaxID=3476 RepID=A0A2P5BUE2_PARAD|nr:hypothetical protein PanWU01x14_209830 [Parasponia andersonii]
MSCDTTTGWKAKNVPRDSIDTQHGSRFLIKYFSSCPLISNKGKASNEREEGD